MKPPCERLEVGRCRDQLKHEFLERDAHARRISRQIHSTRLALGDHSLDDKPARALCSAAVRAARRGARRTARNTCLW